jgi:spore germination protein YaaH
MQLLVFSFIDKKHKSMYFSPQNTGFNTQFNNIKQLKLKQFKHRL